MSISDAWACVRGSHYGSPGVVPVQKHSSGWWSAPLFPALFPLPFPGQLCSTALCAGGKPAASSIAWQEQSKGLRGRERTGSKQGQEDPFLQGFIALPSWGWDALHGVRGLVRGCSEPAAVVSGSPPPISGIQGFNPGAGGWKASLLLKKSSFSKWWSC